MIEAVWLLQSPVCSMLPYYRREGSQAQLHHSVLISQVYEQLWFSSKAIQVRKGKLEEEDVCPKRTEKSEKEVKWYPNGEVINSLNASQFVCLCWYKIEKWWKYFGSWTDNEYCLPQTALAYCFCLLLPVFLHFNWWCVLPNRIFNQVHVSARGRLLPSYTW